MRRSSWTWNTPYSLIFSPFLTAFSRSLTLWSLLPVKYCSAAPNDSGSTTRTSAWMPTSSTTPERAHPGEVADLSGLAGLLQFVDGLDAQALVEEHGRLRPHFRHGHQRRDAGRQRRAELLVVLTRPGPEELLDLLGGAFADAGDLFEFAAGGDSGDVFCQTFQRPGGAAVGGGAEWRFALDLQHVCAVAVTRRNGAILH